MGAVGSVARESGREIEAHASALDEFLAACTDERGGGDVSGNASALSLVWFRRLFHEFCSLLLRLQHAPNRVPLTELEERRIVASLDAAAMHLRASLDDVLAARAALVSKLARVVTVAICSTSLRLKTTCFTHEQQQQQQHQREQHAFSLDEVYGGVMLLRMALLTLVQSSAPTRSIHAVLGSSFSASPHNDAATTTTTTKAASRGAVARRRGRALLELLQDTILNCMESILDVVASPSSCLVSVADRIEPDALARILTSLLDILVVIAVSELFAPFKHHDDHGHHHHDEHALSHQLRQHSRKTRLGSLLLRIVVARRLFPTATTPQSCVSSSSSNNNTNSTSTTTATTATLRSRHDHHHHHHHVESSGVVGAPPRYILDALRRKQQQHKQPALAAAATGRFGLYALRVRLLGGGMPLFSRQAPAPPNVDHIVAAGEVATASVLTGGEEYHHRHHHEQQSGDEVVPRWRPNVKNTTGEDGMEVVSAFVGAFVVRLDEIRDQALVLFFVMFAPNNTRARARQHVTQRREKKSSRSNENTKKKKTSVQGGDGENEEEEEKEKEEAEDVQKLKLKEDELKGEQGRERDEKGPGEGAEQEKQDDSEGGDATAGDNDNDDDDGEEEEDLLRLLRVEGSGVGDEELVGDALDAVEEYLWMDERGSLLLYLLLMRSARVRAVVFRHENASSIARKLVLPALRLLKLASASTTANNNSNNNSTTSSVSKRLEPLERTPSASIPNATASSSPTSTAATPITSSSTAVAASSGMKTSDGSCAAKAATIAVRTTAGTGAGGGGGAVVGGGTAHDHAKIGGAVVRDTFSQLLRASLFGDEPAASGIFDGSHDNKDTHNSNNNSSHVVDGGERRPRGLSLSRGGSSMGDATKTVHGLGRFELESSGVESAYVAHIVLVLLTENVELADALDRLWVRKDEAARVWSLWNLDDTTTTTGGEDVGAVKSPLMLVKGPEECVRVSELALVTATSSVALFERDAFLMKICVSVVSNLASSMKSMGRTSARAVVGVVSAMSALYLQQSNAESNANVQAAAGELLGVSIEALAAAVFTQQKRTRFEQFERTHGGAMPTTTTAAATTTLTATTALSSGVYRGALEVVYVVMEARDALFDVDGAINVLVMRNRSASVQCRAAVGRLSDLLARIEQHAPSWDAMTREARLAQIATSLQLNPHAHHPPISSPASDALPSMSLTASFTPLEHHQQQQQQLRVAQGEAQLVKETVSRSTSASSFVSAADATVGGQTPRSSVWTFSPNAPPSMRESASSGATTAHVVTVDNATSSRTETNDDDDGRTRDDDGDEVGGDGGNNDGAVYDAYLPEPRFCFDEHQFPQFFFVPYCWSLALSYSPNLIIDLTNAHWPQLLLLNNSSPSSSSSPTSRSSSIKK